jgi:hypothetical protein
VLAPDIAKLSPAPLAAARLIKSRRLICSLIACSSFSQIKVSFKASPIVTGFFWHRLGFQA